MPPSTTLESLFANPARLPVMPRVVQQLMASFAAENVSIGQVAAQIEADPVISAKTLRLANSAYFRASRTVASVEAALQMLGFKMVRNLVVGCGVAGAFGAVRGLDMAAFWRYSLQTACGARWLAQVAGDDSDLAFTVGLLHGLGHLVMHSEAPQATQALDAAVPPLAPERARAERAAFGFDHGAVAAELVARWNFPPAVVGALRQVPFPTDEASPLAAAVWVHVAAWRARAGILGWDAAQFASTVPVQAARLMHAELSWQDDPATLAVRIAGAAHAMPDPAALSQGLEGMLAAAAG